MWSGLQLEPGEREPAQRLLLHCLTCGLGFNSSLQNVGLHSGFFFSASHVNWASTRARGRAVEDMQTLFVWHRKIFNTHGPARGLRLAMPSSDGEDPGLNTWCPARGPGLAMQGSAGQDDGFYT